MLRTTSVIGGLVLSLLACGNDRELNVTAPAGTTSTTLSPDDAELAALQATYEACELVPPIYEAIYHNQPQSAAAYAFDLSLMSEGTALGDAAHQLAQKLENGEPFEDTLLTVTAECPVDLWPQELPPVPEGVLDSPDHAQ